MVAHVLMLTSLLWLGTAQNADTFPLKYISTGVLTIVDDSGDTNLSFYRDAVTNQTKFKYEWVDENGKLSYHVDVVREEFGQFHDYFWYEDENHTVTDCTVSNWSGSSNRTPFYELSLESGAVSVGSGCYNSTVPGYGSVQQCYSGKGTDATPLTADSTGTCCPGANHWDFKTFDIVSVFEPNTFDLPACFGMGFEDNERRLSKH